MSDNPYEPPQIIPDPKPSLTTFLSRLEDRAYRILLPVSFGFAIVTIIVQLCCLLAIAFIELRAFLGKD